jgi:parvulin-like peptidyl-prolyl isomerase
VKTRAWARSPLLHFVVLGGALFAGRAAFDSTDRSPARAVRDPITISAERIRTLESAFRESFGAAPTRAQRSALVEQAVQEEMLYREARTLALELEDGSVRRRLVEKMRALDEGSGGGEEELVREAMALGLDDDVVIRRLLVAKMRLVLQRDAGEPGPSEVEVAAWIERHRSERMQPETLTLSHVFFSEDRRGSAAEAVAALAGLRSGAIAPPDAFASSDPFPLGNRLRGYSKLQLQGRFGKDFADTVVALAPGAWSGPIRSPFGLHLVRIDEKTAASPPPHEALRTAAVRALLADRASTRLARGLARLRALYEVRIAEPL